MSVTRRREHGAAGRDPWRQPDLARTIIAETGLDMSRFPDAAHLVSWAGLCPWARQSGIRTRAGQKGHGNGYLRGSLGQAAIGADGTATFLGERYRRIARRRGKTKAQGSPSHGSRMDRAVQRMEFVKVEKHSFLSGV